MYQKYFKKLFDIVISLSLFIFLFPVMILIYLLVWFTIGSPIFRQKRSGLSGEIFNIYKFKTMTDECDKDKNLLSDELRVTKFGKFLRSTSLDELPGLWNVLKGEMSLVGPRPLLVEYLPYYSDRQAGRHKVRPGVTGWAQVNGRNSISWEEKFEFDLWYVDNSSLWLDIKILWFTIKKVLFRDGILPHDKNIMQRFDTMMTQRKSSNEK